MADTKRFQPIEKSKKEIRQTVLTNVVKMVTERGLLSEDQVTDTVKGLTGKVSSEGVGGTEYEFKLDEGSCYIKIAPLKITTINKSSDIANFLKKHPKSVKILVVDSIGKKAIQQVQNSYENSEVFTEEELMINLRDHVLVPKHTILTEEQTKNFYKEFNTKKKGMPRILTGDPVARYYNMKPNDIVRILRPSGASGVAPFYRLVVKGEMKK